MQNARETTETASAANHLENYNRAERTPPRSDTVDAANRSASYVVPSWLHALAAITAPYLAVTKCNHARDCHTGPAN